MLFLVVLHYKIRGRPTQARPRPEPDPKIEARRVQWDGHGQDFFRPEITNFFSPAQTRPSPKMLRSRQGQTSGGLVPGREG
jgi:hypothetical protein